MEIRNHFCKLVVLLLALSFTTTVNAAFTLQTTFVGGNGFSGNMFDVVAKNDISVTGFQLNVDSFSILNYEIYTKTDTWVGFQNNSAAWTLIGSGTVQGNGQGNASDLISLTSPVSIATGSSTAFYTTLTTTDITYSNGTAVGNVFVEDENVQILEGSCSSVKNVEVYFHQ